MAIKKIRFPLEMENGAEVRTIEELRENYSMEKVLLYFLEGKLVKWLRNNYLDEEADSISALDPEDSQLNRKICNILEVEYSEAYNVNLSELADTKKKMIKLKEYTSDKRFVDAVDKMAFDQGELDKLLRAGLNEVYLCGERFIIPLYMENIHYIGVNKPIAVITSSDEVDFKAKNISLENVQFNEEYLKLVAEERINADLSRTSQEWIEPQLKQCRKCIAFDYIDEYKAKDIVKEYLSRGYVHYSMLLIDFLYDERHSNHKYRNLMTKNGCDYELRNLISIIADNLSYIKKYTNLSKDIIDSLKMNRTDYDENSRNNLCNLLKYSGLMLFNLSKEQNTTINDNIGTSIKKYVKYIEENAPIILESIALDEYEEAIMTLAAVMRDPSIVSNASCMISDDMYDFNEYYNQIRCYNKAMIVGVLVPEEVNKKIVPNAIRKDFVEQFRDRCKCEGYILPFDRIMDILSSNETILMLEKSQKHMFLYRDTETNNSWFTSYSGSEFNEKHLIYKNVLKDNCFEDYCPNCGAKNSGIKKGEVVSCSYCGMRFISKF